MKRFKIETREGRWRTPELVFLDLSVLALALTIVWLTLFGGR